LEQIKNTLKNNILPHAQFKYDLRIWDNKIIVIYILDIQIAYDIIPTRDDITVRVILRKDCDMSIINRLYPFFPKGKDRKTVFITSISNIQTSFIDFMKNEMNRIENRCLFVKQMQSA
jgi:hypothetical protein